MNRHLPTLIAFASGLLVPLLVGAPYLSKTLQEAPARKEQTQLSAEQLQQLARKITVKILSGNSWGSGILIQKQGQIYTVLTNQHVLDEGKSYLVQTPDGRSYPVKFLRSVRTNDDLGLVQFRSTEHIYTVASLKQSVNLTVDEQVFSAGFPFKISPSESGRFELTTGRISILLERPFIGGYQIGYTNDVKRGMSGGPLLDRQGVVVGINGMRKYPLWDDPYVFKDGSTVSETMWERMSKLSWAVPIQSSLRLMPTSHTNSNQYFSDPNPKSEAKHTHLQEFGTSSGTTQ